MCVSVSLMLQSAVLQKKGIGEGADCQRVLGSQATREMMERTKGHAMYVGTSNFGLFFTVTVSIVLQQIKHLSSSLRWPLGVSSRTL